MRQARILRGILSLFSIRQPYLTRIGIQRILSQTGRSSMPGEQNLQVGCRVRSLRISRGFAISRHGCNPPARLSMHKGRSRSGQSGFKVSITILPIFPWYFLNQVVPLSMPKEQTLRQESFKDRRRQLIDGSRFSRNLHARQLRSLVRSGRQGSLRASRRRPTSGSPSWSNLDVLSSMPRGATSRPRSRCCPGSCRSIAGSRSLSSLVALPCPHRAWWPTRFGSCPIRISIAGSRSMFSLAGLWSMPGGPRPSCPRFSPIRSLPGGSRSWFSPVGQLYELKARTSLRPSGGSQKPSPQTSGSRPWSSLAA